MAGLQQIQDVLERVLGAAPLPFHMAFWRGRTCDELVAAQVLDQPLIVVGQPEASPLVQALRGTASGPIRSYFGPVRAGAGDLAIIEQWIRDGCPEVAAQLGATRMRLTDAEAVGFTSAEAVGDDQHTAYWRAIDYFFQPTLASPETKDHVLRLHNAAWKAWKPSMLTGTDPTQWPTYLARADVATSFAHVRHHQRRLLQEYYGGSQDRIFDSLWKFGGNLLPIDPQHPLPPITHHTMNGLMDWFWWVPYLDASLRAADAEAVDVDLVRAWQLGIVADGLLRKDADRPVGYRMPIGDFNATDPDLRSKVVAKYIGADAPMLIAEMVRRAQVARDAGIIQP